MDASALVHVSRELRVFVLLWVKQGCVMSSWLFITHEYLDCNIKELKARTGELGVKLKMSSTEQPVAAGLFADNAVLMAE